MNLRDIPLAALIAADVEVIDVQPGSPEWLQQYSASKAAAMLGLSPYQTRDELMHEMHSGAEREHSDFVQARVLDHGHRVEAAVRGLIEQQIGEDLAPLAFRRRGTRLTASCDGITLGRVTAWECKQLNAALAASVADGVVPDTHMPQCQQILLVTGAARLIFSVSDGTEAGTLSTEVLPDPANPMLLVHVTDDAGVRGTGETWWGTYQPSAPLGAPVAPIKAMVDHVLGPACVGRRADDIQGVWEHLYRASYQYGPEGIVSSAMAGIDLALWDHAGRVAGQPVAALLGTAARKAVPAYASLTWYGAAEPAVADARRAVAAGFRAVKLHEGSSSVVLAVRDALGPDIAIMVDVSARFTEGAAVDFARAVEAAGAMWIEEPVFPQQDHAALARVAAAIAQPLFARQAALGQQFERAIDGGEADAGISGFDQRI